MLLYQIFCDATRFTINFSLCLSAFPIYHYYHIIINISLAYLFHWVYSSHGAPTCVGLPWWQCLVRWTVASFPFFVEWIFVSSGGIRYRCLMSVCILNHFVSLSLTVWKAPRGDESHERWKKKWMQFFCAAELWFFWFKSFWAFC